MSVLITYNGKTQSISRWALDIGITRSAMVKRLDRLPPTVALSLRKYQHSKYRGHDD